MSIPIIITPRDEVDLYASLPVTLANGCYMVSITRYRCRNPEFGEDPAHGGVQDALTFKDRVLGVAHRAVLDVMSASDLVGVFVGKGSRRNIIRVLRYIDEHGLLDASLGKQAALQKICDDYIGLDCNGFVGNWANENCIMSVGPNTRPVDMGSSFERAKRTSLEDIQPYDILVWHNHVAAVHSIGEVTGGPNRPQRLARVAEAFGAIMCQDRVIRPSGRAGEFQVEHHRGTARAFAIGLCAAAPMRVMTA